MEIATRESKLLYTLSIKSLKNSYFCIETKITKNILGKIRDFFNGEHKKFARFLVISTGFFIIIWLIGPGNTFIHWIGAALEISEQKGQIEQYEKEIKDMDERIKLLTTDKDTLEKFAREKFYFAAPDEDIYIIED